MKAFAAYLPARVGFLDGPLFCASVAMRGGAGAMGGGELGVLGGPGDCFGRKEGPLWGKRGFGRRLGGFRIFRENFLMVSMTEPPGVRQQLYRVQCGGGRGTGFFGGWPLIFLGSVSGFFWGGGIEKPPSPGKGARWGSLQVNRFMSCV